MAAAVTNPAVVFGRFAKRFWSFKLKEPFEGSESKELCDDLKSDTNSKADNQGLVSEASEGSKDSSRAACG